MVGSKANSSIGLSWADEVEREEEEARNLSHEQQKPNPFGSARPREVVLAEKGIDWRKIDQNHHQPSNPTRKEKVMKENIPLPTALAQETQAHPLLTKSVDGKEEGARKGGEPNEISPRSLKVHEHRIVLIGPPLLYPPKNVITMEDKFPDWDEFDRQREEVIRELSPHRYRHIDHHENHMEWERENSVIEPERRNLALEESRRPPLGKTHGARGRRMSAVHGDWERENMNLDHNRMDFYDEHPRLVNGRRNSLPGFERGPRAADEDFHYGNMEFERGRFNIAIERRIRRSPIDEGRRNYPGVDHGIAGFRGNYENVRPKPGMTEDRGQENVDYLYENQSLEDGEVSGPWIRAVNRKRPPPHQKVDTGREGCVTDRKRWMKPGFNNPLANQKRRR